MPDPVADPRSPTPGQPWRDPRLGLAFVWLPTLALWVAKYPVTNGEYHRFQPSHSSGDYRGLTLNDDRQPAANLSFHDATSFCAWLTDELHAAGALGGRALLRLPSHLEWTTFARCDDGREFPWGNTWPPTFGNYGDAAAQRQFPDWEAIPDYDDGFAVACAVEQSGANPWGLYGVGGNVYEWTFAAGGTTCELRGGSWSTYQPEYLKLGNRYRREPASRLFNFGFRVVLTL